MYRMLWICLVILTLPSVSGSRQLTIVSAEMKDHLGFNPPIFLFDEDLSSYAQSMKEHDGMWVRVNLKEHSVVEKIVIKLYENYPSLTIVGASIFIKSGGEVVTECGRINLPKSIVPGYHTHEIDCPGFGNVVELSQEGKVGLWKIAEIQVFGSSQKLELFKAEMSDSNNSPAYMIDGDLTTFTYFKYNNDFKGSVQIHVSLTEPGSEIDWVIIHNKTSMLKFTVSIEEAGKHKQYCKQIIGTSNPISLYCSPSAKGDAISIQNYIHEKVSGKVDQFSLQIAEITVYGTENAAEPVHPTLVAVISSFFVLLFLFIVYMQVRKYKAKIRTIFSSGPANEIAIVQVQPMQEDVREDGIPSVAEISNPAPPSYQDSIIVNDCVENEVPLPSYEDVMAHSNRFVVK